MNALHLAYESAKGLNLTPKNIQRLAKDYGEFLASWALSQLELQKRASKKFDRYSEMYFVKEALEQASHQKIANFHATLFPQDVLIVDLCCGIGSDLMAFAGRGPVKGYELDAFRLLCAEHNVSLASNHFEFFLQDSLLDEWDFEYAYADPARRDQGKKVWKLEEYSPNPYALAERMKKLRKGLLKLSPALSDEVLLSLGGEVQWISYDRECREALILFGEGVVVGQKSAVHVESGEKCVAGGVGYFIEEPLEYIYEADPAVIRADCLGSLSEQYDLRLLGRSQGYLTSVCRVDSVWFRRFRVIWSGSYHVKEVQRVLRELDGFVDVVKLRGVDLDPVKVRKNYLKGQTGYLLMLYPVGRSVRAVLALIDAE